MSTIVCNACSMEIDCNTAKCEHCKSVLLKEDWGVNDEWEDDFRFIEEAELKGNVYKLESSDGNFFKVEPYEERHITQGIKEEPEIQIDPDIVDDEQTIPRDTGAETDQTDHRQYQCSECTMCFKRKASLRAHVNAEHFESGAESERPIVEKKSPKQPKSRVRAYKCKICQKLTKDYKEHINHVQSHRSLRNTLASGLIKCNHCNKTFPNSFDYKVHRDQVKCKKGYQCDICKAFLSNESILKQHKVRVHNANIENSSKERKYRCVFCGEMFAHQILMINHKKMHAEDTQLIEESAIIRRVDGRLTYVCKTCGKSSSNKSRHTDHLRVHTKEKPFKCELCGTGFTTNSSLVQHLRLHSDERPFKCHICEATYRHKRNLRKHLFRHTGERPFKCEYCVKTFALNTTKNDHVRLIHTGETPYQCEVCEQWFTTSFLLNGHRRTEHDIDTNTKPRVEILTNKIATTSSKSSSKVKR